MNERQEASAYDLPAASAATEGLPLGDHPLEVAARDGFGPLSAAGRQSWHGGGRPCVSCGQLVLRDSAECHHCGQDLRDETLARMRAHAGPWFVFEHVRPFPGVTLERIIRQIQRGLITATSIVRGPSTDYQWRFAVESPGLCRFFGTCWSCHQRVTASDTCPACGASLLFDRPTSAIPPSVMKSIPAPTPTAISPLAGNELDRLAVVVRMNTESWEGRRQEPPAPSPGKAAWISAFCLAFSIIALLIVVLWRM